jgi:CheY-like chemotaxis protein
MSADNLEISKIGSAVVGEVTSSSLHSLKNYLQGIIGLSEILDATPEMPADARSDAKAILKIAEEAAELVNQMRAAARKHEPSTGQSSTSIAVQLAPTKRSDVNILVVDDDPLVLRVVAGMLKALGYGTVVASGGKEAYEKYLEEPESISIVLADLDMPEISGLNLTELLLKEDPNLKIIVMTGYIHEELGLNPDEFGLAAWLEKPMTASRLETVITSILNG